MAASRSASLRFCCSCCLALLATSSCSSSSSLRPEPEYVHKHKREIINQIQTQVAVFTVNANTCIKTHLRWCHLPSWGRAAPAGWHRCSLTWAPNAMKVLTSAPVSVAPPPYGETENNKTKRNKREQDKKRQKGKNVQRAAHTSPTPHPPSLPLIDLLHYCWTSHPC